MSDQELLEVADHQPDGSPDSNEGQQSPRHQKADIVLAETCGPRGVSHSHRQLFTRMALFWYLHDLTLIRQNEHPSTPGNARPWRSGTPRDRSCFPRELWPYGLAPHRPRNCLGAGSAGARQVGF